MRDDQCPICRTLTAGDCGRHGVEVWPRIASPPVSQESPLLFRPPGGVEDQEIAYLRTRVATLERERDEALERRRAWQLNAEQVAKTCESLRSQLRAAEALAEAVRSLIDGEWPTGRVPVDAYSEWTDVESALATFTRAKERHEKNEKEG